jgi:hypothetical protein
MRNTFTVSTSELEQPQADSLRTDLARATASRNRIHALSAKCWAVLLAVILCAPGLASAGAMIFTYDYTGSAFTNFSTPPGQYPGKRVSGSFSVNNALVDCSLSNPCDISDYDFSDGVNEYVSGKVTENLFSVFTGEDGGITGWVISLSQPPCPPFATGSCGQLNTSGTAGDNAFYFDAAGQFSANTQGVPGAWECRVTGAVSKTDASTPSACVTSQAPEPRSLPLILVAFVAIWGVGVVRKSVRAARPSLRAT